MDLSCQFSQLAVCVPEQVLTNNDLAKFVDTNDQWIVERTGIHQRHKIDKAMQASDLGLAAAEKALATAGINSTELTHVIVATCTPDYLSPSVACIIAGALGCNPVMAFDVESACAGFIYGLSLSQAILAAHPSSSILFVCTEALTRRLNWQDRSTCVLFGDGAAACILSKKLASPFGTLKSVICESDGKLKDLIIVGGGTACQYDVQDALGEDFFLSMQGRDTYKHAVRQMVNVCRKILAENNLSIDDIDLFIPHQANLRIIEAVGARLNIAPSRVFTNVGEYGNTSAASIPLAIYEANALGLIKPGYKVLLSAFGAGLTWGASILQF